MAWERAKEMKMVRMLRGDKSGEGDEVEEGEGRKHKTCKKSLMEYLGGVCGMNMMNLMLRV